MLCRVDPLVVVPKSRCMRKNHSRRVPHEEAARRQEQISSRHLLQAGGQGCVRRFQISPDHGFHRKSDSLASRDKAGVGTALVTGRRTELRRFQISPDHGFHRKCDSSSSRKKKIPQSRAPPERPPLDVEGESSHRRYTCCRGGKRAWRHRPEWSVVPT